MDVPESVRIEIAYKRGFNKKAIPEVKEEIHNLLSSGHGFPKDYCFSVRDPTVESVILCDQVPRTKEPKAFCKNVCIYSYTLHDGVGEQETIEQNGDEALTIANHWLLPAREFHGLWESLIYEDSLKEDLLSFILTTMLFSKKNVNSNLVSCNRLILLHGPPGTGKTSLCQALSQKLAIRMYEQYTHFHQFEINCHSLFSKWFSESGKLVQKVFSQINELCQDPSSLVCVLVDEVESIAFARETISNNEPSDSIRVVNAVLTQLDRLRRFSNVIVLATSNLTSKIDLAFLDRADIVQYIGNPSKAAIYEIYRSALINLQSVGILQDQDKIPALSEVNLVSAEPTHQLKRKSTVVNNLEALAEMSVGLSGRSLRKVPFLAHALYVKQNDTSLVNFVSAMRNAVRRMLADKAMLDMKLCQPISMDVSVANASGSNGVGEERFVSR